MENIVNQMPELVTLDSVIELILTGLKSDNRHDVSGYGYDVHPSHAAYIWARKIDPHQEGRIASKYAPLFFEAAWELSRRGVLRPGVITHDKQATADWGYSLTEYGRQWLKNHEADFFAIEPGALSVVLGGFKNRFGEGFHQRSQEAIRCRQVEAWLACCTMVGAASESILLRLAIEKVKNEADVLAEYGSRDGRRNVTNLLVGKSPKHIADTLRTFLGLLAYWRDEAAHGQMSELNVANADEALRQLLHMVQWSDKNWAALTT
jgi:hypothetical protein